MHTYSFTNSILNFKKLSFNLDANMSLDILKEFFMISLW